MRKNQRQAGQFTKRTDTKFAPERYPPSKLPVLTEEVLQAIVQNKTQLPTEQELDAVLAEQRRATEKIDWMITAARPDTPDRVLSANATLRATFSLDALTKQGRAFREQQKLNAGGQKTPHLDAAIQSELRKEPSATSREIWDALSHFDDGDLRIRVVDDCMEWDYRGSPVSSGQLQFVSFESKVSRLRNKPRHK